MAEQKSQNDGILKNEDELIRETIDLAFGNDSNVVWYNAVKNDDVIMEGTVTNVYKSFKNGRNNNGVQTIKGYTLLDKNTGLQPKIFYKFNQGFRGDNIEWEQRFDDNCSESSVVKYLDINHTVGYTSYKSSFFGVSSRDFNYIKTRRYYNYYDTSKHKMVKSPMSKSDDGKEVELSDKEWNIWSKKNPNVYYELSMYLYYDILKDHKYFRKSKAHHVRGYCIGGVLLCKKIPNIKIEMRFISRMDVAGYIPQWIVNYALKSKVEAVSELKKTLNKVVKAQMDKMSKDESNQNKGNKSTTNNDNNNDDNKDHQ